jgi:hypothetical protein
LRKTIGKVFFNARVSATDFAVASLSPVIIIISMPLFCKNLMADFAFSLILSLKPKTATAFPSIVK